MKTRRVYELICQDCKEVFLSHTTQSTRCQSCRREHAQQRDVKYQTDRRKKMRDADKAFLAIVFPNTLNARQLQRLRERRFVEAVNKILAREVIYAGF